MNFVLFYHSLISDWNHGNAHFLRGVATELMLRGHRVDVYEPADSWSVTNLLQEYGPEPIEDFRTAYPHLQSHRYDLETLDLEEILDGADAVIVHEWSNHTLVRDIGLHRAKHRYHLLFHDTHHRAVTDHESMGRYDLGNYDGVLAYGAVLRDLYLKYGWAARAWTWHEAADTRMFFPRHDVPKIHDLVWIGNWGDDERTDELHEFLIDPAKELQLDADVFGVRYPEEARAALAAAGIRYGGWLPNFRVADVFARNRMTVHVPRRPYVLALPGIPTIRPFEAMACGIPMISAPWDDVEGLFTPGSDFLIARSGNEMRRHMQALLCDKAMAREISDHALQTILRRHTCVHRVDELLQVIESLTPQGSS